MHAKSPGFPSEWADPDLPEWTDAEFAVAQLRVNGAIVREATGKMTPARPPAGSRCTQAAGNATAGRRRALPLPRGRLRVALADQCGVAGGR
jgi:hypothetical protein